MSQEPGLRSALCTKMYTGKSPRFGPGGVEQFILDTSTQVKSVGLAFHCKLPVITGYADPPDIWSFPHA
jgi:hypothetical protein